MASSVKGIVDLVFLVDVTGSMQPCIEALTRNIGSFIDTLTARGPNNECPVKDWRGKVVGFRDWEVDSRPLEDHPFVRDAAELKAQLSTLEAGGGGDEPETLLDALYVVASMEATPKGEEDPARWRARGDAARVVVVFTDASYKPRLFRPEVAGGTLEDVFNVCEQNRIVLSVFAPDMPCHDELSQLPRSEYMPVPGADPQQALADFTADQANFRRTLDQLARSVSKSCVAELEAAQ